MSKIAGKSIEEWEREFPILKEVMRAEEVCWRNPGYLPYEDAIKNVSLTTEEIREAEARLERFAPFIASAFPEMKKSQGIIESPLKAIPKMKKAMKKDYEISIPGKMLLKCDSHLPISGSIKARGGIYEVLKHAEDLAFAENKLKMTDDYAVLDSEAFRDFYSHYEIVVGSTGNLGLSIGIMSAKIGFQVTVHMSADAMQWKKDLLREKGATVVEHSADYSKAVEEGRKQSEAAANSYFVDDENSSTLFLGYAVAASRLQQQLEAMHIRVDKDHPLFVYLPCGVGGGPGGVAFGLKTIFKDAVHCFFAEPTHSPCMLLGLMTGKHQEISVADFGLDNQTSADGLAVGRPSGFVGKTLQHLISGDYTVSDDTLFRLLSQMADTEDIWLEPSALAGVAGPVQLIKSVAGKRYMNDHDITIDRLEDATHIAWATGGSMVPKNVMKQYKQQGQL
ncbi:D-serine ammonia-lyase [Virgibacillus halophilus]|uniref:D-serine ammonia-lyase n=1 Tax=Tigheibacillus halophilus TaxID=361280 RepID=UPI003628751A